MKHFASETSSRFVVTATERVFCLYGLRRIVVNKSTTHLIMDAKQVEIVANALRTLPFDEAYSLMVNILNAFFQNKKLTSCDKTDTVHGLIARLEHPRNESIQTLMQSAKSELCVCPSPLKTVQLILCLIESYLLEYLANDEPAVQFVPSNNLEHLTTCDDDDDGACIELFVFPTKVCALSDADKSNKTAND